MVHCCEPRPPLGLFVQAGARGVSLDFSLVTDRDDEALGETVEAGVRVFLGAVPSLEPVPAPGVRALLTAVQARWSRLGFDARRMAEIVVTVRELEIVSAITRTSAETLGHKPGDKDKAIDTSTEVLIDMP